MSRLRRYPSDNAIYFLTHITYNRRPILDENAALLLSAIESAKNKFSFENIAWAILPDHVHIIINPKNQDISNLMQRIKQTFSMNYRKGTHVTGKIWQLRFCDHVIRNQDDLNRHIDYIHYNPVKHGLVKAPGEYAFSSFRLYLQKGAYGSDWGAQEEIKCEGKYGE